MQISDLSTLCAPITENLWIQISMDILGTWISNFHQTCSCGHALKVAFQQVFWKHLTQPTRGISGELEAWGTPSSGVIKYAHACPYDSATSYSQIITQIARFMWPTWGPPGSCRPQMGPMLAPWTLLLWHAPSDRAECNKLGISYGFSSSVTSARSTPLKQPHPPLYCENLCWGIIWYRYSLEYDMSLPSPLSCLSIGKFATKYIKLDLCYDNPSTFSQYHMTVILADQMTGYGPYQYQAGHHFAGNSSLYVRVEEVFS